MTWEDMCGRPPYGKSEKITLTPPFNFPAGNGLPSGEILVTLYKLAAKLDEKENKKTKGMHFHICLAISAKERPITLFNNTISDHKSAAICYEDLLFDKYLKETAHQGDLIIRQSKAPCDRCKAGYKELASRLRRTIVVCSDEAYETEKTLFDFIFTQTKKAYHL